MELQDGLKVLREGGTGWKERNGEESGWMERTGGKEHFWRRMREAQGG